jgi:hypothetical protein
MRCGYSTTIMAKAAAAPAMAASAVEEIARRVVADLRPNVSVVAVARDENAWSVMVRTEARRVVQLLVSGETPAAIRAAIRNALPGI